MEDLVDEALLFAVRDLAETVGCFHATIGGSAAF
jgi:hypothetical protein